jgi:hypothetical protein
MAYKIIASQCSVCSVCSACEPECPNSLHGRLVGSFGDLSVFDFSPPSALCCGEGGMVVNGDDTLASELRYLRSRSIRDQRSISVGPSSSKRSCAACPCTSSSTTCSGAAARSASCSWVAASTTSSRALSRARAGLPEAGKIQQHFKIRYREYERGGGYRSDERLV